MKMPLNVLINQSEDVKATFKGTFIDERKFRIIQLILKYIILSRNLSLPGNCFKYPRQAILMKDTEEILSYLRNLIPR